jgi:hypothetical protein
MEEQTVLPNLFQTHTIQTMKFKPMQRRQFLSAALVATGTALAA